MTGASFIQRYVSYPLQGILGYVFFAMVRLLPLQTASDLGGKLGRWIGPRVGVSHRARRNLGRAFAEKPANEIDSIVVGMWDNLGRVLFEYPVLQRIDMNRHVEIIGIEHLLALRDDDRPGILFAAHTANWEILPLVATAHDLNVHVFYRQPNNPYVANMFARSHLKSGNKMIPKGPKGARQALQALGQGGHLGILVDQKMNDGIAVPFFGRDAMTAPALAQMALKYDCPVVAARTERLQGAKFRITFSKPMSIEATDDRHADILAIMTRINQQLEQWIRDKPAQWLWLHNRWPD
mgnify:CR=1 FL=1